MLEIFFTPSLEIDTYKILFSHRESFTKKEEESIDNRMLVPVRGIVNRDFVNPFTRPRMESSRGTM